MSTSAEESSQFKNLPQRIKELIYQDQANDPSASPSFAFSPNGQDIPFATQGTVFKGDTPSYQGTVGPLTRADVSQSIPEPSATHAGALSTVSPRGMAREEPDFAAMLAKYVPEDDSSSKYLAMASALGRPTGFGSFGEKMANVADALLEQKQNQQKLRAQYTPLIMQHVAAQQARDEQAAYRMEAQQQAQQAQAALAQQNNAARAEQAQLQRDQTAAIAAGNQGLRQDSNATARAHLVTQAMAQYPFGIPPAVMAQINGVAGGGTASAQPPDASGGIMGPGSTSDGLQGDDFLKAIPKPMADQVKALAEGRMSFPTGMSAKSPYWQGMIQAVSQYDPNFDAVNYGARAATRKDFTSGKASTNLNAINTVMAHLDEYIDAGKALDNSSVPLWNKVANAVSNASGDPRITRFNAARNAVIDEVERAYRGSGGSQAGIEAWKENMTSSNSPQQIAASGKELLKLLEGKIDAMGDQYSKGMGTTTGGLELLSPKAQAAYNKVMGGGQSPTSVQGGMTPIDAPSSTNDPLGLRKR